MNRIHATDHRTRAGFTLLEVSASIGILLILATGIFSLTAGSIEMTDELSQFQNRHILKKRFIELCRMNLEAVPGHAKVEFKIADKGQYYSTYLSIVDDPFAFSFGGESANIERVIVEADVAAGGFLRASLLYLDAEENVLYDEGSLDPSAIQRRVVVMNRLRQLSWRFYDTNRQEWLEYWDQPRNPTLVELSLAMEGETTPERAVFWIPPEKEVPVGGGGSSRDNDEEDEGDDEETETESDDAPETDTDAPLPAPGN